MLSALIVSPLTTLTVRLGFIDRWLLCLYRRPQYVIIFRTVCLWNRYGWLTDCLSEFCYCSLTKSEKNDDSLITKGCKNARWLLFFDTSTVTVNHRAFFTPFGYKENFKFSTSASTKRRLFWNKKNQKFSVGETNPSVRRRTPQLYHTPVH